MFEFFIMLFILYVMYKMAKGILMIMAAIMLSVVYVVLYSTAFVIAVVKTAIEYYAKALKANPIITIGSTCAAYAGYVAVSH